MDKSRDGIANTLMVAIGVSLVCSILVSSAAVVLRPIQDRNEVLFRQRIVLQVAGLYEPGVDVADRFAAIEARLVNLETGEFVEDADVESYDPRAAANDPGQSVVVPDDADIAGLKRREQLAPVYLIRDGDRLDQIILPVYGKGLWSTMYGYLSLEADGNTVRGLRFYEHAETPGLGDQIDRPSWRDLWPGKRISDDQGVMRIEVVRGIPPSPNDFQVDGLSGATLTGRGVSNLVRYWTGDHGFGPFLKKLSARENSNG